MSVFKEITLCENEIENFKEKCSTLLNELEKKFGPDSKQSFEELINKENLPLHFIQNKQYLNISLLMMHMKCVMKSAKSKLLMPFQKLFNSPNDFQHSYLPSLPHDDDYEVFENFKKINKETLKFFECANGHLYAIGNCTQPAVTSKCPTCSNTIGGTNHQLAPGNKEAVGLMEKTQFGYFLPNATLRSDTPENIRNMGNLNTCILRLFLHSVLYLCAIEKKDLSNIMSSQVKFDDFFAEQIIKDINILSNCLHHSPDESILIVHFLLSQLQILKSKDFILDLNEKENRNRYETFICKEYFSKLIGNDYDNIIKQMTNVITDDVKNSGTDQIYRIAHDIVQPEEADDNFLNDKKYWSFRKQINIESMVSNFNSISDKNKKLNELKLLNDFILNMNELEGLKYLPSIAKMIILLHISFNRQVDRQYASSNKIEDILSQNSNFNDYTSKQIVRNGCESLLKVWKIIRHKINLKFDSKRMSKVDINNTILNQNDISKIPLSYLLPSTFKDGRFIYCIVFYLINLQNEFNQFFIKNSNESNDDPYSNEKINLNSVTQSNCISFSIDKDILQIVYMHSNYSLGASQDINIEYNFNKIQFTISKRFLEDKCLIDSNVNINFKFHLCINKIFYLFLRPFHWLNIQTILMIYLVLKH